MVFSEEMNNALSEEVMEVEILASLSSMQNGKIPSLDGFTIEFFKSFFDTLK
jgi:hypothetical protein